MVRRNLKARNKTTSLKSMMKKNSSSRGRRRNESPGTSKSRRTRTWGDVHHEKQFWVNDGNILKNLKELPGALRSMSNETFLHHVNEHKNDFANWIEDVVGERKLAEEVRTLQSRTSMMKAVKRAL